MNNPQYNYPLDQFLGLLILQDPKDREKIDSYWDNRRYQSSSWDIQMNKSNQWGSSLSEVNEKITVFSSNKSKSFKHNQLAYKLR